MDMSYNSKPLKQWNYLVAQKIKDETKNGEKVPSLEVAGKVLVQCNLVDNQYKQKFEVLCTFTPKKSYACLLDVSLKNYIALKKFWFRIFIYRIVVYWSKF